MAGKKYGIVMRRRSPGATSRLPETEQAEPGRSSRTRSRKYDGKLDFVRRYWTSSFTAAVSDVFVMECDDPMDVHSLMHEMTQRLARNGNPERFGVDIKTWFGVNPDAGS